jgi:ankyrin repeat protein
MARDAFIDNPAEDDKNCSIHNIFTLLQNEEEEVELDVVLASTDITAAAAGTGVHVGHADVADLLQWLTDNTEESWDDINATDMFRRSALHIACEKKAPLEVINGLLGKLDEKPINAITKYAYLLQWLTDKSGESWDDINTIDEDGVTVLHTACRFGASWEVIKGLLGKLDKTVINSINKDVGSALHAACKSRASWEVINGLLGNLDEKAINAIIDWNNYTALHAACQYGASWEVINSLLGKLNEKAINAIKYDGSTVLHIALACRYGAFSWEVINCLLGKLDEKAITAIDNNGRSALHIACRYEASWEVINGILDKLDEKVINAINHGGATALHEALWNSKPSLEVINGLLGKLDEKAINVIDNNGRTALHIACGFGASSEVINAIVNHKNRKEQASVKSIHGKLPFDIFPKKEERRNEHLKKLLNLHNLMEDNDPTASLYPNGLLQSILNLSSEDRDEVEFINHSYFRKGINAKIIQPFSLSILFLDVAVQGLVMAVFSFTINGAVKELPTTSMAGLIPCLLWLLFREIVQYLSATAKFYFGDTANFVDITQIVLVIAVLLISFIGKGTINEGLLVACIGVAWTRLIFVISNLHYSLALFVAALLQVSSSCYIACTILAMM